MEDKASNSNEKSRKNGAIGARKYAAQNSDNSHAKTKKLPVKYDKT